MSALLASQSHLHLLLQLVVVRLELPVGVFKSDILGADGLVALAEQSAETLRGVIQTSQLLDALLVCLALLLASIDLSLQSAGTLSSLACLAFSLQGASTERFGLAAEVVKLLALDLEGLDVDRRSRGHSRGGGGARCYSSELNRAALVAVVSVVVQLDDELTS